MPPANANVEKNTLRPIATVAAMDIMVIRIVFLASVIAMGHTEIIARL